MACDEPNQRITRVMVIEEDQESLAVAREALSAYGYHVFATASHQAALETLRELQIDVLLCDSDLSSICTIDLVGKLCHAYPSTAIVLMTTLDDIDVVRQAFKAGASDYVMKPLDAAVLPFVLENSIERKRLEAQRLHPYGGCGGIHSAA